MQHSAYLDRPSAKSLFESKKRSLLWEIRKSSKLALKWTFICKKSGFASFFAVAGAQWPEIENYIPIIDE